MKLCLRKLGPRVVTLVAFSAFAAIASAEEAPSDATAPKPTLFVTANGFKGTQGQAIVALYDSKDSWLKIDRAYRIAKLKVAGSSMTASFPALPPGTYAASVIHDANVNGKLDMHWFPIPGPDEGAGVSNDAKAIFGPPSFDDARFRFEGPNGAISLSVRY